MNRRKDKVDGSQGNLQLIAQILHRGILEDVQVRGHVSGKADATPELSRLGSLKTDKFNEVMQVTNGNGVPGSLLDPSDATQEEFVCLLFCG